ncbi:MAG: hypothetical protein GEV28_14675 [Actinophytocola sp.]|uniref:hypothetical protein n=1 Tax=Actinophytocola sp. TaxID=1872138 RepID=UPI0013227074|nr:hypothetical protein [Actinophytocola sp.]MPZ81569.1 hypothetical protein [Actinophytocola sp.]
MTRRAAALLAALLVLPGCMSRTGGAASGPSTEPTTTTTTTTTATTTTTTTTAPPPPATPPADGGNVNACTDGTCEVRVTAPTVIPVDPAFGLSYVSLETITGDEVSMVAVIAGGSFTVGCDGDPRCGTGIVAGDVPTATLTGHPGAVFTLNRVRLTMAAVADGAATLRLSTV